MNFTEIPHGMLTGFLTESESVVEPQIIRRDMLLFIPVFVRKAHERYRYYMVSVPFTGQSIADYAGCCIQSYAALRRYFYGDWAAQNEMILKGTFAAHQYAVRQAFPKAAGEVIPPVVRFDAIKAEFWNAVNAACAAVGKTRGDLPDKFNAEEMLAFATTNGMSADNVATYTAKFSVISLNILQNNRNWDELF